MGLKTPGRARLSLPGCAQSQETDDVITLVFSTVIGRRDINYTLFCVCVFSPSGLSTVKGAELMPHIYTHKHVFPSVQR